MHLECYLQRSRMTTTREAIIVILGFTDTCSPRSQSAYFTKGLKGRRASSFYHLKLHTVDPETLVEARIWPKQATPQ